MPSFQGQNWGLINTMANGIKEGMTTYMTIQNAKREQQQLGLISGMTQDQDGNWQLTPQKQQQIQLQQAQTQRSMEGMDPNSQYSQSMRQFARGLIGDSSGRVIPDTMSATDLNSENSVFGKYLQAQAMAKMAGVRNENQTETRDQRVHQNALNEIEKDPNLTSLRTTYQNLDNAERNFDQGGATPQEFSELQQAVRSNLGIKGTSGVDERSENYLRSLGINADKVTQFLTGDPQSVAKSDPAFVAQIERLVDLEKQNKRTQAQGLLDAKEKGHASFYRQHPDLQDDYENVKNGLLDQFGPQSPAPAQKQTAAPGGLASPVSQKIKVSNGKETLLIDAGDESDAAKDGYKRIK